MRKSVVVPALALVTVAALVWMWSVAPERRRQREQERALPAGTEVPVVLDAPDGPEEAGDAAERELEAGREAAPAAEPDPGRSAPARELGLLVLGQHDEQPIAGARVTTFEGGAPATIETDEEGRCSLRVEPTGDPLRLLVEKEGFFHVSAYYSRDEELTVRLYPTCTLSGQVLAADTGAPVPDARIILVHNYCKHCEPSIAEARADGTYELANVPRRFGTSFGFEAEGFPVQYQMREIRSDEPRVEVDFRLEGGVEINGQVVDYVSGAGIAGARVGDIVADSSGAFRGRILPPDVGATTVRVAAAGYCRLTATLESGRLDEPLELRVPRGAVVEGTVRDDDGEPIAGAQVSVDDDHLAQAHLLPQPSPLTLPEGWSLEPEGWYSRGRSDEAGRFRIENVVPWSAAMVVEGFADGHVGASRSIEQVGGPGEVVRMDLVLERSPLEAVVRGEIYLNGQSFRTAEGVVRWSGAQRSGETEINSGNFSADVEPGEVELRIEVAGLPSTPEGAELRLQLEAGKTSTPRVELRLPTRPIAGHVRFDDGAPAAGVSVRAWCPLTGDGYWDSLNVTSRSGTDGSYLLDVPDLERAYRVKAELDHTEHTREGIRAGASGIDLVLARSGALQFRLRDARTDALLPAYTFELGWKRAGEQEFHPVHLGFPLAPDVDGWYEIRLPAGPVDLQLNERHPTESFVPILREGVRIRTDAPSRVEFVVSGG